MKFVKKVFASIIAVLTLGACFTGCDSSMLVQKNGGAANQIIAQTEQPEEVIVATPVLNTVSLTHTVTINYHQTGKANTTQTVNSGATATKPTTPTYNSNTFINWYCKGEVYDWNTPVTEDITIHAIWKKSYSNALTAKSGSFSVSGTTMTSNGGALSVNENADFDEGTIEVTVTASSSTDSGIVFGLTGNGKASYWEDTGVSYYFFFLSQRGEAFLGKVNNGWTTLDSRKVTGVTAGQDYKLKIVLSGTEVWCYVNDKIYLIFSERNFLQGKGVGIRTGASGISFKNFTVSGELKY